MPRFAAKLTMPFTEAPFLECFEFAARAGFKAVELRVAELARSAP
jgi:hydroxypyruvate isomerase